MLQRKSLGRKKQMKKVRFCDDISMAYSYKDFSEVSDEDSNDNDSDNTTITEDKQDAENNDMSDKEDSISSETLHMSPSTIQGPPDRLNLTYNKLKGKLKEVQAQLRENPRAGKLKLTLFIIALYSKNIELMKPFPTFLMKGYKPDIARTKHLMSNMPDMNLILSYSPFEFYTNYLAIQFLHWLTVETTSTPMTEATYESMFPVFHKINPITHIIKPDIVMKLNGPNTRSVLPKRMVYVVVNTNQIHRLLYYGTESLLDKNQSTIWATNNALVNLKTIEKPNQDQMECSDIDFITLIIAELVLDRSVEMFHGKLNAHDISYRIPNPRLLTVKYLLLYRLGTFDVYQKLVLQEKRKVTKEIQKVEERDLMKFLAVFVMFVFITLVVVTYIMNP